jgi:hypothetical protein
MIVGIMLLRHDPAAELIDVEEKSAPVFFRHFQLQTVSGAGCFHKAAVGFFPPGKPAGPVSRQILYKSTEVIKMGLTILHLRRR